MQYQRLVKETAGQFDFGQYSSMSRDYVGSRRKVKKNSKKDKDSKKDKGSKKDKEHKKTKKEKRRASKASGGAKLEELPPEVGHVATGNTQHNI